MGGFYLYIVRRERRESDEYKYKKNEKWNGWKVKENNKGDRFGESKSERSLEIHEKRLCHLHLSLLFWGQNQNLTFIITYFFYYWMN